MVLNANTDAANAHGTQQDRHTELQKIITEGKALQKWFFDKGEELAEQEIDTIPDPMSWSDHLNNRAKFIKGIKILKKHLKNERAAGERGNGHEYRKYKLAKDRCLLIGADLLQFTSNRVTQTWSVIFGKNLKYRDASKTEMNLSDGVYKLNLRLR